MCGIAGVFLHRADREPARVALEAAARHLSHRGPDGTVVHVEPGLGLAHTRLALVDLDPRSDQPLFDASRRYAIVYNGEVYNFRELRSELEGEGAVFRTTSDTEVLLEMFVRRGVEASLPRLEGMFAFAFCDRATRTLTLARDRFGIKPLYYTEPRDCGGDGSAFLFASETMAFAPFIPFEPDVPEICSYLQALDMYKGPTTRGSFLRGVRTVPPGFVVTVKQGAPAELKRFVSLVDLWDLEEAKALDALADDALVDKVDAAMHASVKMQLFADAKVGVYCSGGVDSSLVAAIASRYRKGLQLFHSDVVGKKSEYAIAQRVAAHLKADLHKVEVRDDDFIERLPHAIRHYEYPCSGRPQSVAFLAVSELVSKHGVKGVLSGEGSDECFLGYARMVAKTKDLLRDVPSRLVARLGGEDAPRAPRRGVAASRIATAMLHHFDREIELDQVLKLPVGDRGRVGDPRNRKSLEMIGYHLRTLLHRNDRLGMAASVEARFPYLDSSLVRLAINLPHRVKARFSLAFAGSGRSNVAAKWIVRKVADRYLPRELSAMRKKGFKVTAQKRLKIARGAFDGTFVADLFGYSARELAFLESHASSSLKQRLLQVNVWAELFLARDSEATVLQRLRSKLSTV